MVWFLVQEINRILAPQARIKPMPPALEGKVSMIGLLGKSPNQVALNMPWTNHFTSLIYSFLIIKTNHLAGFFQRSELYWLWEDIRLAKRKTS